jgi:hypothetical protein
MMTKYYHDGQMFIKTNEAMDPYAEYRRLALANYPDRGGDTSTMQEINAQYQDALARCDGQTAKGTDGKDHTYTYNQDVEQAVMDKIAEILTAKLAGIDIWLIGTWIWVDGDTKPYKKTLGKNGLKMSWHSKRKKWYWHNGPKYRRGSKSNFASLAATYGATHFKNEAESAIA